MPILLASNQSHDYGGGATLDTDVSHFDVAKVSHAIHMLDDTDYTQLESFTPSSTTTTWFHFHRHVEHWTASGGYLVRIYDAVDSQLCTIDLWQGQYGPKVFGDTTVTGTYAGLIAPISATIDISLTVDAANITMSLYVDKSFVSSATAANTVSGKGKPVRMDFTFSDAAEASGAIYVSEIIIAESDTRDRRLHLRPPVAAGFHGDFAGTVADITDNDDDTAMTAGTTGNRSSTTVAAIAGVNIHCVILTSRSATDGTGPANLKQGFRIAGVDYDSATSIPQTTSLIPSRHFFEISPATGVDWTAAEFSAAETMRLALT